MKIINHNNPTKTFKKIDKYVHKELGNEYDLDQLGSVLTELVTTTAFTVSACVAYLYSYYKLEHANQVVKDFFDSYTQRLC